MQDHYTYTAMLFHWLIALLIVAAFTMGLVMTDIPGLTPAKVRYYSWHKWIGITVLLLAVLRVLWRLGHAAPGYPATMPRWQQGAARVLHALLYVLIFAVPLSGYFYNMAAGVKIVYLGLYELPALIDPNPELKPVLQAVHYWLSMVLAATVGVHVAAALKHQFIDRDGVMRRMLPWSTPSH